MNHISLDIETYSSVDLNKSSVYRYSEAPDFEILLFGYSVDDAPVQVVDLASGEHIPEEILAALTDERVTKWAFNANFERVCLSRYLGMPNGEFLDPAQWRCTMIWSAYLGLPLSLMGVGAALMLVGGINWRWVLGAIGIAALLLYVVLFVIGYNTSRITYWLDPWADAQGSGWQLSQSLITIGSGGLWGVGLGKSRQKFLYLPEEHNDFIFSIVCEELGLIGATIIMLLFAALILRGYWIALHARDRFGSLLVVGMTTFLGLQVFLNIGVVTGLLPATGISLPFFSYGGTALCIQLVEMGVVLSVSRQMKPGNSG